MESKKIEKIITNLYNNHNDGKEWDKAKKLLNELIEDKELNSEWINVDKELPTDLETVWCFSKSLNSIFIGCRAYDGDNNWSWAESNGTMYIEDGKIVAECDSDDLSVTHWRKIPNTPPIKK